MVQSVKLTRRSAVGQLDAITLSACPRLDSVSTETEREATLGTMDPVHQSALWLASCYLARKHEGGPPFGHRLLLLLCATLIGRSCLTAPCFSSWQRGRWHRGHCKRDLVEQSP